MSKKLYIFLLLLMTVFHFLFPFETRSETNQVSENEVKTAYLFHLGKYVEWPEEINNKPQLTICVIGKPTFEESLGVISGKIVKKRRVVISYATRVEELKECDILFVSKSEKANLGQILAAVSSRPILTISDIKRFAAAGGMIGFVSVDNKIRFEINQKAVQKSGLRMSAHLLKLATLVVD